MSDWTITSNEDDSCALEYGDVNVSVSASSYKDAHALAYDIATMLSAGKSYRENLRKMELLGRRLREMEGRLDLLIHTAEDTVEALVRAKECNQIVRECGGDAYELFSENLW